MKLPAINEQIEAKFGVIQPLTKMPDCPNCENDELIFLGCGNSVKCLLCGAEFYRELV